jgi:hypothetical protein
MRKWIALVLVAAFVLAAVTPVLARTVSRPRIVSVVVKQGRALVWGYVHPKLAVTAGKLLKVYVYQQRESNGNYYWVGTKGGQMKNISGMTQYWSNFLLMDKGNIKLKAGLAIWDGDSWDWTYSSLRYVHVQPR